MWFKVDDQMWSHPKVLDAGTDALGLWIRAACWSVQHLTDGFVPTQIVLMLLGETYWPKSENSAERLMLAGLWDEVDGGYRFHDWEHYQPPAAEVRERRRAISEARSQAGRAGAQSRWSDSKPDGKPMANAMANARQTDGPEPEPELDRRTSKTLARRAVERASDFDTFWMLYPRKVGKRTAQTAYDRATKRATEADILAGLQRLIPAWTDPQFIPHPTTWLNRDGWEDQPSQQAAPASLLSLAEDARRLEEGRRFFA